MKIAIVGCVHGRMNEIYDQVQELEKNQGIKVDLVIICGDFQAVRGLNDLHCMAVPDKYKEIGDFHEYYSGKRKATHLTIVIGGNHEASNYFQSLSYGGWIANNIYYAGYSNVLKYNGLRIGAISGIFNRHSIHKGHFEHLPYTQGSMRSAYHTRYLDVFRMLQYKDNKLDLMVTHDWPLHIYQMPAAREFLIRKKPHFRNDINNHTLGSPMHETILIRLRPLHWFAAHLHVRFETNYFHQIYQNKFNEPNIQSTNGSSNQSFNKSIDEQINETKISVSMNESSDELSNELENKLNDEQSNNQLNHQQNSLQSTKSENRAEVTHFLALDKCLPRRRYLEIFDIETTESSNCLEYDLDWLCILKCTNQYLSTQEYPSNQPPQPHIFLNYDLDEHKEQIRQAFNDDFKVPDNFSITLPYKQEGEQLIDIDPNRQINYTNEQTTRFCELLNITDPIQSILDKIDGKTSNPDKISISDDEDSVDGEKDCCKDDKNDNSNVPNAKRFKEDEQPAFFIDTKGSHSN